MRRRNSHRTDAEQRSEASEQRLQWLTTLALYISVALVLARAMMLETLRDPFQVEIGQQPYPRGAGAATGLVLDLLCCAPALLVLLRSAVDPAFALKQSLAHGFMLLLGLWTILSPLWASDRFAAAVSAAHWASALVLLWSTSQLVREWATFRLVAASGFALLLVLCAHGIIYRFVELPELQRSVERDWEQILQERGWEPGSFIEQQFRRRVMGGEIIGFSASPNTFAAMVVLLGIVTAGLALQRWMNRDEPGWPIVLALGLVPAAFVLWFTHSRTALATPLLGAALLAVGWNARTLLARYRPIVFFAALTLFIVLALAAVGHGVWHGTLFHDSLTFRWRYWVGAWGVFMQHPLIGVGFANFGLHYLGTRLPVAAEEINDPHNFIVRIFVELGLVGGMLLIGWVGRLWWELTRPLEAELPLTSRPRFTTPAQALSPLLQLAAAAVLVNILASVDFAQQWEYGFIEVLKRLLYMLLLMIGLVLGMLRSTHEQVADDRPARFLRHAVLVALAMFIVHNLVDFSLFETGPMFTFALFVGAALGLTRQERVLPLRLVRLGVAVASALWLTFGLGVVVPVVAAERSAHIADQALRNARPAEAARRLEQAYTQLWIDNADYAFRAARAMIAAGEPPTRVRGMIAASIEASPVNPAYPRLRAHYEMSLPQPDWRQVITDYERVIALDPGDLSAHLDFADALERLGDTQRAIAQYEEALRRNELLPPDEPERLTPTKIEQIHARLRALRE